MPIVLRLAFVSLLLLGTLSAAPRPWTQLKVGMSAEEAVSLLGDPVFRRRGHGFETWTYDHGAEVLIYGLVVGWTAPASATRLVSSEDVWSDHPAGDYLAPVRAVLRKHVNRSPAPITARPAPPNPKNNSGLGYEEYLESLGRNRG